MAKSIFPQVKVCPEKIPETGNTGRNQPGDSHQAGHFPIDYIGVSQGISHLLRDGEK
jgi:hypothetical protein